MDNFYELLEIDDYSGIEEVKASYRKLSRVYHPDRNKSPEAEKKFMEINNAYDTLSNPKSKEAYDSALRNGTQEIFATGTYTDEFKVDEGREKQFLISKMDKSQEDILTIRRLYNKWPDNSAKEEIRENCNNISAWFRKTLREMDDLYDRSNGSIKDDVNKWKLEVDTILQQATDIDKAYKEDPNFFNEFMKGSYKPEPNTQGSTRPPIYIKKSIWRRLWWLWLIIILITFIASVGGL